MNKCNSCGTENAANAAFCGACGAKLSPDINAIAKQAAARKASPANGRSIAGFVALVVIGLIVWGVFKSFDGADIKKVKQTDIGLASIGMNITYGDLLDGYCKGGKWKKFTSSAYSKVVEFTGKSRDGDKVLIQFSDNYGLNKSGGYVMVYFELNGRTVDSWEMSNWLMNAAYYAK